MVWLHRVNIFVNFGPVTPEFKRVKGAHPSSISSLATFVMAAPLLDLAGISTEFSGAITTQFCFTNTLEIVAAMPRGLHARLCHTFLIVFVLFSYVSVWQIVLLAF